MNLMSQIFVKMGDTQVLDFPGPGQWCQPIAVPLTTASDPTPFPKGAKIRYIITPSDRYTPGIKRAFPVGGVLLPDNSPDNFQIIARNSDTAAGASTASFFWLAIAENVGGRPEGDKVASYPLGQLFIGQPASFLRSNTVGDQQALPTIDDQAAGLPAAGDAFSANQLYRFNDNFGIQFEKGAKPLVFATANNVGCGVSPYQPTHNAATVGLVQDSRPPFSPEGFRLIVRNSDVAGSCGFNWVALQQLYGATPPGPPYVANLIVDTGHFPYDDPDLDFNQSGTDGDWAFGEIQFSAPFGGTPVVLISARFDFGASFLPETFEGTSSCAPVAIAQNVTPFGFTLAARNSDTNPNGGSASFDWIAFSQVTGRL